MFETSRPNGAAIAAFARARCGPSANSASADFYRLIPNDTDVSVFRERPWTILNFAIIGNETRYHSPGDTLAALDPRSLRHMGEQALARPRALAADGVPAAGGSRLYMDLLGRTLVVLPMALGLGAARGDLPCSPGSRGPAAAESAGDGDRRGGPGRCRDPRFPRPAGGRADAPRRILARPPAGDIARPLSVRLRRLHRRAAGARPADRPGPAADRLLAALPSARRRPEPRVPGAAIYFLAPPLVAGAAMLARRWERPAALLAWALLFLTWGPLLHFSQILLDLDNGWIFAAMAALLIWPVLIEMKPLLVRPSPHRSPRRDRRAGGAGMERRDDEAGLFEGRQAGVRHRICLGRAEAKGRWLVVNDGAPLPRASARRSSAKSRCPGRAASAGRRPRPNPDRSAPDREVAERSRPQGRLLTYGWRPTARRRSCCGQSPRPASSPPGPAPRRRDSARGREGRLGAALLRAQLRRPADRAAGAAKSPVEATVMGIRPGLPAAAAPLVRARPALAAPQYSPDSTIAVGKVRL